MSLATREEERSVKWWNSARLAAVAVLLCLIAGPAWAAPIVTDVDGTVAQGAELIITGSGFGTWTPDIEWTGPLIEAETLGVDPEDAGWTGWGNATNGNTVTGSIVNTEVRSGSKAIRHYISKDNTDFAGNFAYTHGSTFQKLYASWWIYVEPLVLDQGDATQLKLWRVNAASYAPGYTPVNDQNSEIYAPMRIGPGGNWTFSTMSVASWYDAIWYTWFIGMDGIGYTINMEPPASPGGTELFVSRNTDGAANIIPYQPVIGQWARMEIYADAGDFDTYNAELRMSTHNLGETKVTGFNARNFLVHNATLGTQRRTPAAEWTTFIFQLYFDCTGDFCLPGSEEANVYLDDIYLQFGTQARVEIGNEAVYAACTQLEVQIPTLWADGSITVDANLGGSFAGDTSLYAYVIDGSGVVSAGHLISGTAASSMLMHSTMGSASAIHAPAVSQATYATEGEALPGSANITYVAGPDGNAAKVTSPSEGNGDILFLGDNFDFFDVAQDGGRVDLVVRFDTDPKARPNDWLLYSDPTGGGRWINFEMVASGSSWPTFIGFSDDANTERRAYPEQGWALRGDMWGTYSASDYWDAVDVDEWHTYSWLWRNNGGTDKDEVHLFIDGNLVGSDYNGNLPNPVGNADDLDYVALAGGSTASYSYDDVWSFSSWDVSADTGTFAALAWPDSVFLKHPVPNPFKGDPTSITTSNVITYEFMVFDQFSATSVCSLFVDNIFVDTVVASNLEHVQLTDPQELDTGDTPWQVRTDGGVVSPIWTFDMQYVAPLGPSIVSVAQTHADSLLVTFDRYVDETTAEVIGNYGLAPADATVTSARHLGSISAGGAGLVSVNSTAMSTSEDNWVTSPTVTLNVAATDNFIAVIVASGYMESNTTGLLGITDTIGNTYFQLGTDGLSGENQIWGAYNSTANAANVITVTTPNSQWSLSALALSGVVGSSPLGASQQLGRFSGQNITTSSFSPTAEGSLVLLSVSFPNTRTISAVGSGQTLYEQHWAGVSANYGHSFTTEITTAAGVNEQTMTMDTFTYQSVMAVEILADAGPGGPVPSEEVVLGLSGDLVIDTLYTLTVNNVEDLIGDPIEVDASAQFTATLGSTPANDPPVAGFSASVNFLEVTFTDTSTDPDGTVDAWFWQFGDGSTSALQNPVHTYATHGPKSVTLTVTDNGSATDGATALVGPTLQPPVAAFTWDAVDLDVTFDATSSSVVSPTYAWSFGDASGTTGSTPAHSYAAAGDYTVTLYVSQVDGQGDTDVQVVTVTEPPNVAPVATFTSSVDFTEISFTDTSTDSDGTVDAWSWDFGDGSPASTLQNPVHTYATHGAKSVTLTVTDDDTVTDEVSAQVIATLPDAVATFSYSALALVNWGASAVADTIAGSPFAGYVEITAEGGAVDLRIPGSHPILDGDTATVASGETVAFNLYIAGQRFTEFIVTPAPGATARYVYW